MAQIGETELDVRALARALWRRSWLLVLLAIVAAVGTYFGLGFVDPLYTADTRILIEQRESPLTRPREDAGAPSSDFDEFCHPEPGRGAEVARDRRSGHRQARPDAPGRNSIRHGSPRCCARSWSCSASARIRPIRLSASASWTATSAASRSFRCRSRASSAWNFQRRIRTLAAEVANAVADAFVELQQNAKRESAVAATAWLQQEIERLRGRVAESEQAVADYRAEARALRSSISGGARRRRQSLHAAAWRHQCRAGARARRARRSRGAGAARRQRFSRRAAPLDASEEVLNSQLIQRLRERQGALSAQIAELSTTLLPTHPRIRALRGTGRQSRGADPSRRPARCSPRCRPPRGSLRRAKNRWSKSLNEAKGDVSRSNDQGIELRALQREAAAQRDLLELFLSRYREAAARTDANYLPADARIISRAVAPSEPSFPKKTMMAIAAAVATLLIASAIVLLFGVHCPVALSGSSDWRWRARGRRQPSRANRSQADATPTDGGRDDEEPRRFEDDEIKIVAGRKADEPRRRSGRGRSDVEPTLRHGICDRSCSTRRTALGVASMTSGAALEERCAMRFRGALQPTRCADASADAPLSHAAAPHGRARRCRRRRTSS